MNINNIIKEVKFLFRKKKWDILEKYGYEYTEDNSKYANIKADDVFENILFETRNRYIITKDITLQRVSGIISMYKNNIYLWVFREEFCTNLKWELCEIKVYCKLWGEYEQQKNIRWQPKNCI